MNGKGAATLLNIVAKTNMKLGGLNYALKMDPPDMSVSLVCVEPFSGRFRVEKWLSGDVLFCGCDVNHPPPMSAADRRNTIRPPEGAQHRRVGVAAH